MRFQETMVAGSATHHQQPGVGELVIGAADGDGRAWEELVAGFSGLVSSITEAHRLSDAEATRVRAMVWRRLGHNLGKIRQPDRIGTWVAAVARDECVKVLTYGRMAAQPAA